MDKADDGHIVVVVAISSVGLNSNKRRRSNTISFRHTARASQRQQARFSEHLARGVGRFRQGVRVEGDYISRSKGNGELMVGRLIDESEWEVSCLYQALVKQLPSLD